ncbi:probable serine/threonine-protein kinase PIX13 [Euphorbia lathyris]|uniref:probable serine/threonine-protein kinase PIX13 n=1 Tax=Euphorbia lathyris TaxID=212925 RepID=UPI0033141FF2
MARHISFENYNAKISGFGLAILGPSDGDSHVTTQVIGIYGYRFSTVIRTYGNIATGDYYMKSDVYSFGVVLLELMTGLRASDPTHPAGQQNLVDWLKPILSQKIKLRSIIDKRIEGRYSLNAMLLATQLSLKCLESDPEIHPSMKEVVNALE